MKHPNYDNEILKTGQVLVEVPSFSGYFVDPAGTIFSCAGKQARRVTIWQDKTKAGYIRERVHLNNDIGEGCNMSYKKVMNLTLGEKINEQRSTLGEMF